MSIKTLRKRIALVAVSALGVGLLSVAPASAAVTITVAANGATSTSTSGLISGAGSEITTTDGTARMLVSGQLAVTTNEGAATSAVVVSGGYIVSCSTTTNTVTLSADKTTCSTDGNNAAGITSIIKPLAVGTPLVIMGKTTNSAATWSTETMLTVTVVADSTIGTFSAGDSYLSVVTSGAAASDNVDDKYWNSTTEYLIAGTRVSNTGSGYFGFDMKDVNGNRLSGKVIGANVTSGCVVGAAGTGTFNAASTTTPNSYFKIDKAVANAPASCTLTVSINGTPVASRTYTFVGKLAKLAVSELLRVKAGTTANADAFYVEAMDSAGNLLDAVSVSADTSYYSASLTDISTVTTSPFSTSGAENYGDITCPTKGTYKAKVKATDSLGTTIYSDEFSIVCAGSPVTYTASLDKASHAPGELATLTITAKDSAGNLTHDYATLGTDTTAELSITGGSQFVAVTAPQNEDLFLNGVKKYKFNVGATEGSYNFVVDLPKWNSTTYAQAAVTVPVTIKSASTAVSNAEVLAAIVKLIASINKQIRALQKSLKR